jgi:hypothetical protein
MFDPAFFEPVFFDTQSEPEPEPEPSPEPSPEPPTPQRRLWRRWNPGGNRTMRTRINGK